MYAIVEIAGQQFKVEKDQQLYVHRLENKEGEVVSFDNVLLIDNDGKVNVGAPAIEGASVSAKVMEHLKGDKVIVFKKKRRKGYRKKNGHRQYLTSIQIEGISEKGGAKKATAKAKPAPKQEEAAEEKPAAKKAAAKKPAAKKEAAPKKEAAAKKPAAKKAPAKKAAPKKEDSNENKKEG
jgi:large subunit ribosomal protein L21